MEMSAYKIRDLSQDSEKGVLCVNQGDTLRVGIAAHEHAIAARNGLQGPYINGKVYFELSSNCRFERKGDKKRNGDNGTRWTD